MEIREDVNHHRRIKTDLQALGHEHGWQRKPWRVLRYSRYIADFSPDLSQEDWPAEETSARIPGKGGPILRSVTLGDFMGVRSGQAATWSRPTGERRPAQDPPPAAAAVWPKPSPRLGQAKWTGLASVSAACPATSGFPEIWPSSRTLPPT